ncbi:MAG TPA: 3'(2'),5'-bisphosphate nucleotidase CysQ [Ramlibacter sp.]|uniref:3'(2'),5'-bisphosphate nucleotidase CysQ n=1 Tax=Ramlibacter sp. TaxID=1917967 RepID=UPI002BA8D862|nr:3'(2'),5'-bisphosphate nucleotidase CysQ [Ramlibacter sp.]HVZ46149.1 3'(2'),5'-bisphosphate nucleotidase CysQ [Ramlibacter sp.]
MRLDTRQLDLLCDIARAAGREIMDVYARDIASWSKDDASPLTEADLRADAVIRERLESGFPGIYVLSEESAGTPPAGGAATFFLVDPLDGTKEFLKRNDEFTVNIALIHGGEPVAGVVYVPALDEMFAAARGVGAWKEAASSPRVPLKTASCPAGRPLRVIGSRSHAGPELDAWLKRLGTAHEFVPAGSSLKFCRLAEGAADVYPRHGPTSQWDTAAAQAVLECAGGAVRDAGGQAMRYGLDRPMLNPYFIALADPALAHPPL